MLRETLDYDFSDSIIISFLKGKTGFSFDNDNLVFNEIYLETDSEQSQYAEKISQLLKKYNFVFTVENLNYQVKSCINVSGKQSESFLKFLNLNENLIISKDKINNFLVDNDLSDVKDYSFYFFYNGFLYFFEQIKLNTFLDVYNFYSSPLDASLSYKISAY